MFPITGEQRVVIRGAVVERLVKYRQQGRFQSEAGGILLGRILLDSRDYVIDEISTPKRTDKRRRHYFYRSNAHHKIAVNRWKQSDGRCLYLGLWHSHPEPVPSPSTVDIEDWKRALVNGKYEGNSLLFLILGTSEICCWRGTLPANGTPQFDQLTSMKL